MKKIMYSMMLASLVGAGHVIIGMEPMELVQKQVTLKSNDGRSFTLSLEEANFIPIVRDQLQMGELEHSFKLLDGESLELILTALSQFLGAETTQALLENAPDFFAKYTPSDTPGLVREALKPFIEGIAEEAIQKLLTAADFFLLQWLVDGVNTLKDPTIIQVYSIADLIALNRLPKIVEGKLILLNKNLASVAGIELIPSIDKVTQLNLEGNQLSELPDAIGDFQALEGLSLKNNLLSELPDTIGNLQALKGLDLSGNQLSGLPSTIGNLRALRELEVSDNYELRKLPDAIGNLQALTVLSLDGNQLSELPDTIGNLKALRRLELSDNQLRELPNTIGDLQNLGALGLSHNRLSELPDTIGNLQELEILNLGNNQLSRLPDWIGNLRALTTLNLSNNKLVELPDTIGNLERLGYLSLAGNPLDETTKVFLEALRRERLAQIFLIIN